jgi:hypothetical protein
MPELDQTFAADAVDTTTAPSYEALPAGDYFAVVTQTDVKTTKAGTGQYVAVTLEVADGPHKGRRVWDNINFQNPSAKAQEIGKRQLAELCKACGVTTLQRTEQLHGKVIKVRLGQEPGQDGTLRNRVKGYLWKESSPSAQATSGRADIEEEEVPF